MRILRVPDLGAAAVLLVLAAAPARSDGMDSSFTFRVTQATVTTESQNVVTNMQINLDSGTATFLSSPVRPKRGRAFVLLKLVVRNNGASAGTVLFRDLVFRGENGQPIPWMTLESDPKVASVPMYSKGAFHRELAPTASCTEDLLLNAPGGAGAITMQYRSQRAVPIGVTMPPWFKLLPAEWYLALAAIGILAVAVIAYLAIRRRNSPDESAITLGLR